MSATTATERLRLSRPTAEAPRRISPPTSLRPAFRHDVEHQAIRFGEVGLRDALHVASADVHEDVELSVSRGDIVVDDGGVREVERLLLVRLAADYVVTRELVLGALKLVRGHRLVFELVELCEERLLRLVGRPTRLHDSDSKKEVRIFGDVAGAGRGEREPLVVDELAHDSR